MGEVVEKKYLVNRKNLQKKNMLFIDKVQNPAISKKICPQLKNIYLSLLKT